MSLDTTQAVAPARRSTRTGAGAAINPDSIGMFKAVTIGVFLTFSAHVTISAFALYAIGEMMGLGWLSFVVPLGIDAPILVATGAALIQQRRGHHFFRWFASGLVFLMTIVSGILNHLEGLEKYDLSTNMGFACLIIATLAPLLIFANVEVLIHLVTKLPPTAEERAARRTEANRKAAAKARKTRAKAPRKPLIDAAGRISREVYEEVYGSSNP